MCGIVGFHNDSGFDQVLLDRMTDSLTHRGSDGRGTKFWPGHRVGIGHRRLSILDLSEAGLQPMTFEDSDVWITLNGEIYNYLELREQLGQLGYRFKTQTDTEVALAAFLEWDTGAFEKFNGMWAIALYNARTHRLILCIDRFGVKPLYYRNAGGKIHWASELKAFLSLRSRYPLNLDRRGILTAIASPGALSAAGKTWLQGIEEIPGGHYLEASPAEARLRQWWNTADHLVDVPGGFPEQAAMFRELFFDSCRMRLRSDVPIGVSLSGGLDSSAVTVTLDKIRDEKSPPLHIFSHAFPGTALDESAYAQDVVQALGGKTIWTKVSENNADLDALLRNFEAIYPGIVDGPWRIYEAQKKAGIKVSVDGHGADELLGGYHHYLFAHMVQNMMSPRALHEQIAQYREQSGAFFSWKSLVFGLGRSLMNTSDTSPALLKIKRALDPVFHSVDFSDDPYAPRPLAIPRHFDLLNRTLYEDFHRRLLPRILRNFEVVSMAHGIEVRMPFMDYRLVKFSFSLPSTSKVRGGYSKILLREALKKELPASVRSRQLKIGFNSPLLDWLPTKLRPWIEGSLAKSSPLGDIIDSAALLDFYRKDMLRGRCSWEQATRFWSILSAIRLSQITKLS